MEYGSVSIDMVVISDFYFHWDATQHTGAKDVLIESTIDNPSQRGNLYKQEYFQLDKTAKDLMASLLTAMTKKAKDW